MKIIIICSLFVAIISFCFWYFYLSDMRENDLTQQGDRIINEIESYKNDLGILPLTLGSLGENDSTACCPFFYRIMDDSVNYTLSFGLSIDDYKIYYSKDRLWKYNYEKGCYE